MVISAPPVNQECVNGSDALSAPLSAGGLGGTSSSIFQHPQLERRKSVKDLVTDFSSCISTSGEEEPFGDLAETVTRRKKKKRKASSSPILAPSNGTPIVKQ